MTGETLYITKLQLWLTIGNYALGSTNPGFGEQNHLFDVLDTNVNTSCSDQHCHGDFWWANLPFVGH